MPDRDREPCTRGERYGTEEAHRGIPARFAPVCRFPDEAEEHPHGTCGGCEQEVIELASKKGTLIISSPHDTFTTAKLLDLSMRKAKRYDLLAFLITNPLKKGEKVLVKVDKQIIERAFEVEVEDDEYLLPGTMSRKKDFIPAIGYFCSTSD